MQLDIFLEGKSIIIVFSLYSEKEQLRVVIVSWYEINVLKLLSHLL